MVDRILDDVRRLLELRGGRLETVVCGGVSISKARPVTLPAEPDGDWHDLTYAEQRVARFVGEGLTNNAVATALGVSPHTVSTHLRHVFEKLGINTRVALARFVVGLAESA
jgi:DNA-binding CsgD family transcriptional regulator